MRHIRHVTIDTGHVRDCPRSDVPDHVVAALAPLVVRMADGEEVDVPGGARPACTMSMRSWGRSATITVRGPGRVPLVLLGLADHSRAGARLWRDLGGDPDRCPAEPWCAMRLLRGLAGEPEAWDWLGDLARCLAWAWVERRGKLPHAIPRI